MPAPAPAPNEPPSAGAGEATDLCVSALGAIVATIFTAGHYLLLRLAWSPDCLGELARLDLVIGSWPVLLALLTGLLWSAVVAACAGVGAMPDLSLRELLVRPIAFMVVALSACAISIARAPESTAGSGRSACDIDE